MKQGKTTSYGKVPGGGYLQIDTTDKQIAIPITIPAPGIYRVRATFLDLEHSAPLVVGLAGDPPKTLEEIGRDAVDLGTARIGTDQTLRITAQPSAPFGCGIGVSLGQHLERGLDRAQGRP